MKSNKNLFESSYCGNECYNVKFITILKERQSANDASVGIIDHSSFLSSAQVVIKFLLRLRALEVVYYNRFVMRFFDVNKYSQKRAF